MSFWLTTHWPPRKGKDPNDIADGVWIRDGKEMAAADLKKGDKILVYQARSGRSEIREDINGKKNTIPCIRGKEEIVAICEAKTAITTLKNSKPSKYIDGTEIWWRWYAPWIVLSKSGFVSREKINTILNYKPKHNFRGFSSGSGIKKISEIQFNKLVELFKGNINVIPHITTGNFRNGIPGGESKEHLLLKEYVASHPSEVLAEEGIKLFKIEYPFPTGDRADILLEDKFGKILGIEIEVNVADGQLEGPLQALKYRFMSELITSRNPGDSKAILIAYKISEKIKSLCQQYNIQCIEVNKDLVDNWYLQNKEIMEFPK